MTQKVATPEEEKGKVVLKVNAYAKIVLHCSRFANARIQRNKWKEVYGFLVGTIDGDDVVVNDAIPMTHGGSTEVQFEERHYIEAAELDSKLAGEGNQFIVGWYHSHPGLDVFFSWIDVRNHMGFQGPNPKSMGLVFDHTKLSNPGDLGFEIYRIKEIHPDSGYYEVKWVIPDMNERVFAKTLFELSTRSAEHKPLIDEYGEEAGLDTIPIPPTQAKISLVEPSQPVELAPETAETERVVKKLEKALEYGRGERYENAVDLGISAAKEFERLGDEGRATDAYVQVGGFFLDFYEKNRQIRTDIFSHKRDPKDSDIDSMVSFAKLLNTTSKQIDFNKTGLENEIKGLSGEMIKVQDVKIQISNILIEASMVCQILARLALEKKNLDAQIRYYTKANNTLSTAIIFARDTTQQTDLVTQIFDFDKISSDISRAQARIQELHGLKGFLNVKHLEAANLFAGAGKLSEEGSNAVTTEKFKKHLFGYSKTLFGRGYQMVGEHEKYVKRDICKSVGYYRLAQKFFEEASSIYPIWAKKDIDKNKGFLDEVEHQIQIGYKKCLEMGKTPREFSMSKEVEIPGKIILSEPEPLFFP